MQSEIGWARPEISQPSLMTLYALDSTDFANKFDSYLARCARVRNGRAENSETLNDPQWLLN
jgi:hypothetical protein